MFTITCLVTCLRLLIWETQPKTTMGAERELTIYNQIEVLAYKQTKGKFMFV